MKPAKRPNKPTLREQLISQNALPDLKHHEGHRNDSIGQKDDQDRSLKQNSAIQSNQYKWQPNSSNNAPKRQAKTGQADGKSSSNSIIDSQERISAGKHKEQRPKSQQSKANMVDGDAVSSHISLNKANPSLAGTNGDQPEDNDKKLEADLNNNPQRTERNREADDISMEQDNIEGIGDNNNYQQEQQFYNYKNDAQIQSSQVTDMDLYDQSIKDPQVNQYRQETPEDPEQILLQPRTEDIYQQQIQNYQIQSIYNIDEASFQNQGLMMQSSVQDVENLNPASCQEQEPQVPFYVLEQQERAVRAKQQARRRIQYFGYSTHEILLKNQKIQAQFQILERFINVSRVFLNRFQAFLVDFKDQYLKMVYEQRDQLIAPVFGGLQEAVLSRQQPGQDLKYLAMMEQEQIQDPDDANSYDTQNQYSQMVDDALAQKMTEFQNDTQSIFVLTIKAYMCGHSTVDEHQACINKSIIQTSQSHDDQSDQTNSKDQMSSNDDEHDENMKDETNDQKRWKKASQNQQSIHQQDSENQSQNARQRVEDASQQPTIQHKLNLTSMKHCLKRIYKACQIQLDDFQWKNGPYRESSFALVNNSNADSNWTPLVNPDQNLLSPTSRTNQDSQKQKQEDTQAQAKNEATKANEDLFKHRTQLLKEIIEIEQTCKQYLDLFKRNFIQLYDLLKHDVLEMVLFSNDLSLNTLNQLVSEMDFNNKDPEPGFEDDKHYFDSAELQYQQTQINVCNRIRMLYLRHGNCQNFMNLQAENMHQNQVVEISMLEQFFNRDELKYMQLENILLMSLLEIGNTIDGVAIAAKILNQINLRNEGQPPQIAQKFNKSNPSLGSNFSQFQNWKKRKCHCCMEYILDAGKAVACVNIILKDSPCHNIYCQNCIVSFMEEKHNYEEDDLEKSCPPPARSAKEKEKAQRKNSSELISVQNQTDQVSNSQQTLQTQMTDAEKQALKEKEERKIRHKLWLKACQNVLFICPCCQGYCLNDDIQASRKTFSHFSLCNFKYKLDNHPRSFLRRDVYWYRVQGNKKYFHLAKIVSFIKQKQMYKIELLQTSQTFQVRLSQEEFFFSKTVKPGSKLFEIIDEQGFELDLRAQIDMQIKDFQNYEPFQILNKYEHFLDRCEQEKSINDGFNMAKFVLTYNTIRGEFLQWNRKLYQRFDEQMFDLIEQGNVNILLKNDSEEANQLCHISSCQFHEKGSNLKQDHQSKDSIYNRNFQMIDEALDGHKDPMDIAQNLKDKRSTFSRVSDKVDQSNHENQEFNDDQQKMDNSNQFGKDNQNESNHGQRPSIEQQKTARRCNNIINYKILNERGRESAQQQKLPSNNTKKGELEAQLRGRSDAYAGRNALSKVIHSSANLQSDGALQPKTLFKVVDKNQDFGQNCQILVQTQQKRDNNSVLPNTYVERKRNTSLSPCASLQSTKSLKSMHNNKGEAHDGQTKSCQGENKGLLCRQPPLPSMNEGQKMILDKNIQLAEQQADGDQVSLLINKQVFRVEKVQNNTGICKNPIEQEDIMLTQMARAALSAAQAQAAGPQQAATRAQGPLRDTESYIQQQLLHLQQIHQQGYHTRPKPQINSKAGGSQKEPLVQKPEPQPQSSQQLLFETQRIKDKAERLQILQQDHQIKSQRQSVNSDSENHENLESNQNIKEMKETERTSKMGNKLAMKIGNDKIAMADGQNQTKSITMQESQEVQKVQNDRIGYQDYFKIKDSAQIDVLANAKIQDKPKQDEVDDIKDEASILNNQTAKKSSRNGNISRQNDMKTDIKEDEQNQESEQDDESLDFDLREFLINEKKEYNLRRDAKVRAGRDTSGQKSSFSFNEQTLLRQQGLIRQYQQPVMTQKAMKDVEEGFYDDWPVKLIKKFKLKVSKEKYREIYGDKAYSSSVQKQESPSKFSQHAKKQIDQPIQADTMVQSPKQQELQPVQQQVIKQDQEMEDTAKIPDNKSPIENNIREFQLNSSSTNLKIDQKAADSAKAQDSIQTEEAKVAQPIKPNQISPAKPKTAAMPRSPSNDRLYIQKFKMTPQIESHCQYLRGLASTSPTKLEGYYYYMQIKDKDLWKRILIKKFHSYYKYQEKDYKKRIFLVQYQNEMQSEKAVDLLEHKIMIDTNYRNTNQDVSAASCGSSVKSKKENENQAKKNVIEANSGQLNQNSRRSEQADNAKKREDQIRKILSFPLYNSKKRVRKLLQNWMDGSKDKKLSQTPSEKQIINNQSSNSILKIKPLSRELQQLLNIQTPKPPKVGDKRPNQPTKTQTMTKETDGEMLPPSEQTSAQKRQRIEVKSKSETKKQSYGFINSKEKNSNLASSKAQSPLKGAIGEAEASVSDKKSIEDHAKGNLAQPPLSEENKDDEKQRDDGTKSMKTNPKAPTAAPTTQIINNTNITNNINITNYMQYSSSNNKNNDNEKPKPDGQAKASKVTHPSKDEESPLKCRRGTPQQNQSPEAVKQLSQQSQVAAKAADAKYCLQKSEKVSNQLQSSTNIKKKSQEPNKRQDKTQAIKSDFLIEQNQSSNKEQDPVQVPEKDDVVDNKQNVDVKDMKDSIDKKDQKVVEECLNGGKTGKHAENKVAQGEKMQDDGLDKKESTVRLPMDLNADVGPKVPSTDMKPAPMETRNAASNKRSNQQSVEKTKGIQNKHQSSSKKSQQQKGENNQSLADKAPDKIEQPKRNDRNDDQEMNNVEKDDQRMADELMQEPGEPNEEWIKNMKLKMISKSREQINKKVLKFYHQEIVVEADQWNECTQSCDVDSFMNLQQKDSIIQDEVSRRQNMTIEQNGDMQRVKINQLIRQIKHYNAAGQAEELNRGDTVGLQRNPHSITGQDGQALGLSRQVPDAQSIDMMQKQSKADLQDNQMDSQSNNGLQVNVGQTQSVGNGAAVSPKASNPLQFYQLQPTLSQPNPQNQQQQDRIGNSQMIGAISNNFHQFKDQLRNQLIQRLQRMFEQQQSNLNAKSSNNGQELCSAAAMAAGNANKMQQPSVGDTQSLTQLQQIQEMQIQQYLTQMNQLNTNFINLISNNQKDLQNNIDFNHQDDKLSQQHLQQVQQIHRQKFLNQLQQLKKIQQMQQQIHQQRMFTYPKQMHKVYGLQQKIGGQIDKESNGLIKKHGGVGNSEDDQQMIDGEQEFKQELKDVNDYAGEMPNHPLKAYHFYNNQVRKSLMRQPLNATNQNANHYGRPLSNNISNHKSSNQITNSRVQQSHHVLNNAQHYNIDNPNQRLVGQHYDSLTLPDAAQIGKYPLNLYENQQLCHLPTNDQLPVQSSVRLPLPARDPISLQNHDLVAGHEKFEEDEQIAFGDHRRGDSLSLMNTPLMMKWLKQHQQQLQYQNGRDKLQREYESQYAKLIDQFHKYQVKAKVDHNEIKSPVRRDLEGHGGPAGPIGDGGGGRTQQYTRLLELTQKNAGEQPHCTNKIDNKSEDQNQFNITEHEDFLSLLTLHLKKKALEKMQNAQAQIEDGLHDQQAELNEESASYEKQLKCIKYQRELDNALEQIEALRKIGNFEFESGQDIHELYLSTAFEKVEHGLAVLDQGYAEQREIEEELIKLMQLQKEECLESEETHTIGDGDDSSIQNSENNKSKQAYRGEYGKDLSENKQAEFSEEFENQKGDDIGEQVDEQFQSNHGLYNSSPSQTNIKSQVHHEDIVNSENVKQVNHFQKADVKSKNSKSNEAMKDTESEHNERILDFKPGERINEKETKS